jgi:hypothetical protein
MGTIGPRCPQWARDLLTQVPRPTQSLARFGLNTDPGLDALASSGWRCTPVATDFAMAQLLQGTFTVNRLRTVPALADDGGVELVGVEILLRWPWVFLGWHSDAPALVRARFEGLWQLEASNLEMPSGCRTDPAAVHGVLDIAMDHLKALYETSPSVSSPLIMTSHANSMVVMVTCRHEVRKLLDQDKDGEVLSMIVGWKVRDIGLTIRCPFPGCKRVYPQPANLRYHWGVHTGERRTSPRPSSMGNT